MRKVVRENKAEVTTITWLAPIFEFQERNNKQGATYIKKKFATKFQHLLSERLRLSA